MNSKANLSFKNGLVAGIPISIGYIPIGIAFGLLAKTMGIPVYIGILMSLTIFAGASQFVGVNLIALGVSYPEIILTTFILNFRHFLMSASISQKLEKNIAKKTLALLSFGITDETFMVNSMREESKLPASFVFGVNLIGFSSWNVGTWLGIFLGSALPASVQSSMGIALYVMFIGLLVPSLKKSRPFLIIALVAMGISAFIHWVPPFSSLSTGWNIIITTIISDFIGAILFPKGDE